MLLLTVRAAPDRVKQFRSNFAVISLSQNIIKRRPANAGIRHSAKTTSLA
jgi:hypothetical protein